MQKNTDYDLETKLIHQGHSPDPATGALASPIYQTATFAAHSVEHFEELCRTWGYVYSRECNPNLTELESKLGDCLNPAVTGENRRSYCQRGRDLLPHPAADDRTAGKIRRGNHLC